MTKHNGKIGAGDIEFELGGQTHYLKPGLGAAQAISRFGQGGGLRAVAKRIEDLDLDAFVFVIAQGLDLGGRGSKDLPGLVFREGLANLVKPLSDYLAVLLNGGRPISEDESEGRSTDDGTLPQEANV